jgi:hypothetical protein
MGVAGFGAACMGATFPPKLISAVVRRASDFLPLAQQLVHPTLGRGRKGVLIASFLSWI